MGMDSCSCFRSRNAITPNVGTLRGEWDVCVYSSETYPPKVKHYSNVTLNVPTSDHRRNVVKRFQLGYYGLLRPGFLE